MRHSRAVASLFLSRVDTLVDTKLAAIGSDDALSLRGRAAVAMAKLAYQRYLKTFHGEAFAALRLEDGAARIQTSTIYVGQKNLE